MLIQIFSIKDPQNMGKTPRDIGLEVEGNSWHHVKDHRKVQEKKSMWSQNFINEQFLRNISEPITPEYITRSFVNHALNNTKTSRTWMETNQTKLPDDPILYPGKMDHVTCISFRVGPFRS